MIAHGNKLRSAILSAAVAALLTLAPVSAAHAGKSHQRHNRGHAKHHRVVQHGPAHHAHVGHHPKRIHFRGRFAVPARIGHAHVEHYRPYYQGRAYYAPHRHHHTVYDFPVRIRSGYVVRPHYYCGGDLYGGHVAYRGPRVSFGIRF